MGQGVADDESGMTTVQHLSQFRRVLIWAMASWAVGATVTFVFEGFFSASYCTR
jgi:hypothetical protein